MGTRSRGAPKASAGGWERDKPSLHMHWQTILRASNKVHCMKWRRPLCVAECCPQLQHWPCPWMQFWPQIHDCCPEVLAVQNKLQQSSPVTTPSRRLQTISLPNDSNAFYRSLMQILFDVASPKVLETHPVRFRSQLGLSKRWTTICKSSDC